MFGFKQIRKRFQWRPKRKNKLPLLMNNLEKIGKISALRLERDYTDSVINDLTWIQESFIKVLKLKHNKPDLFFSLIDPHNRFQKVTFNQSDFLRINAVYFFIVKFGIVQSIHNSYTVGKNINANFLYNKVFLDIGGIPNAKDGLDISINQVIGFLRIFECRINLFVILV